MLFKAASQRMQSMLGREWLDANIRGSYSSNTSLDCPTRRYHGLLISDAGYLPDKYVFLAKLETSLTHRDRTIDLFTNKHPGGSYFPEGHSHIESFRYDRFPTTIYRVGPLLLERSQLLLHEEDTVLIRFRLLEADPKEKESVQLIFRPLLAYRSHHHLRRESTDFQVKTFSEGDAWKVEPVRHKPPLYMTAAEAVAFYPGPYWIKDIEYGVEQERGFDFQEDLFCPGIFEAQLSLGGELTLAFSLSGIPKASIKSAWDRELRRREALFQSFAGSSEALAHLKFEAEKFLVLRRDQSLSVVAGYPWFGEWGRDAMIALPGLTLARAQAPRLLAVAQTFLAQADRGLVPNFLGQGDAPPNYSSIDAGLWLFYALDEYWQSTKRAEDLRPMLPRLQALLLDLQEGRCPLAHVDEQGLLHAGTRETQLTWMDAKVRGTAVTPRNDLAVEINALWFHALGFIFDLCRHLKEPFPTALSVSLERFPAAFRETFWQSDVGYLADTVAAGKPDRSLRPNQIFAVSLSRTALTPEQQRAVVDRVTAQLLTPYGLRTLAPNDPAFAPFYTGDAEARDAVYHQGTVWPWLVYHYALALMRVEPRHKEAKAFLRQNLQPLWTQHLAEAGLMGVSEIFDAYSPYAPNGCIFQAWSMAEVIRLMELLAGD